MVRLITHFISCFNVLLNVLVVYETPEVGVLKKYNNKKLDNTK